MSDPSVVSLSSQSQQDNSPPDVQRGVIMNKLWPIEMVDGDPMTVLKFRFLNGTDNKKDAVRTTILKRQRDIARKAAEEPPEAKKSKIRGRRDPITSDFEFITWEDCANIEFQETEEPDADIRITFKGGWFSTAIGTDAREFKPDSMGLNGLENEYPPSIVGRANILHEFGHALGLEHEHQSPSGEKLLVLDEEKIKSHYAKKGRKQKEREDRKEWAQINIIDKIKKDEGTRNYTNLDTKSIMIYDIFDEWQTQTGEIKIGRNYELSRVDQACIKLMYPPDLAKPENRVPFMDAMVIAGVDQKTAGEMIGDFVNNMDSDAVKRLETLRNRFIRDWKDLKGLLLFNPGVGVMSGIDPASLRQSGINDFVGEVTKNKLFQSIVKNVIYRVVEQRGIPTKISIPGATQIEVTKMVAALSMHDELGQLVRQHSIAFPADEDDDGHKTTNSNNPSRKSDNGLPAWSERGREH